MARVWDGQAWVRAARSDTDCDSDDDGPLTQEQQVVAILNTRVRPPPLPSLPKHANATARAVTGYLSAVPAVRRTRAHDLALSLPRNAPSIDEWVDTQLRSGRKQHTIKTALTLALNPSQSATWACRETGSRIGHQQPILGLAYNVRMHPFTRAEVGDARDRLEGYKPPLRLPPRRALQKYQCGTDVHTLEAAVSMVVFQSTVRYFGAPRYRCTVN